MPDTITRRELIDCAFKAINFMKDEISSTDRNHLLYAACTMPQVALCHWAIDENCGCLVGTMLLNERDPVISGLTLRGYANDIEYDVTSVLTQREALDADASDPSMLERLGEHFDYLIADVVNYASGNDLELADGGRIIVLD